jgi:hypothetical protein
MLSPFGDILLRSFIDVVLLFIDSPTVRFILAYSQLKHAFSIDPCQFNTLPNLVFAIFLKLVVVSFSLARFNELF